jgi:hypothetical protein
LPVTTICRFQIAAARIGPPVGDDALGDAGRFVGRLLHRQAVDQVLEADDAVDFGQDRPGVGVPLRESLAALDRVAVVDEQTREPKAMRLEARSVPSRSTMTICRLRAIAISRPSESLTALRLRMTTVPSKPDSSVD